MVASLFAIADLTRSFSLEFFDLGETGPHAFRDSLLIAKRDISATWFNGNRLVSATIGWAQKFRKGSGGALAIAGNISRTVATGTFD